MSEQNAVHLASPDTYIKCVIQTSVRLSIHLGFPTIIWKSNHSINFKFCLCICLVSVQNWFTFGPRWPNFVPLVAKNQLEMGQNVGLWPLSQKYSHNPIQTCGVHLLGECSEFIHYWATLAKFWLSCHQKITENGGFRPLSEKVFM